MANTDIFKNVRVYWLAFIAYWGIVLFGYDTGIAGGVVSQQNFQKHFGMWPNGQENKALVTAVSSNIVSVLQAGAFFGALGSAPISKKVGRKWTLIGFTFIFAIGAILTTAANSGLALIYSGRVISGVGIGGISAVAPAFVSECSPKQVRGRITGLFQIMVATGVMLSYFINYGVSINIVDGPRIWRIPFGFQLVPAGIMLFGLFTVKESPRWLASVDRTEEAFNNLAYLRRMSLNDPDLLHEFAEIEAAIEEERQARKDLGWKEAFLGKGNLIRFVIAFVIFLLQQWCGQNSIAYYAPQIFASIGFTGNKNSLLASGIYGVVKLVATSIFIFFGVDSLGRRWSFFISAMGMGIMFFIIGAVIKTHPPPAASSTSVVTAIPPASRAMAGLLYIYVVFYSMGWGPLPWVYVADIFPTSTRHYGLAIASASQWLWNFVVSHQTLLIEEHLGFKFFFMFGTVNIGAMAVFSLLIPETKGRSLEEMDVIFGMITEEKRQADVARAEQKVFDNENSSTKSHEHDEKV